MNEDRIIDIETKLTHQEQMLSELNDALVRQQAHLDRLDQLYASLSDRLKSLMDNVPFDESMNQRPPHY